MGTNARRYILLAVSAAVYQAASLPALADQPAGSNLTAQVETLLRARCVRCHGGDKPKAGLDLASLQGLFRGSRNGPVVTVGKPGESVLWQQVQANKMPPKSPLTAAEKDLLHQWLKTATPLQGASRGPAAGHWAFRPLQRVAIPAVRDPGHVLTPIDAFILHELAGRKLHIQPEADRHTLLRRLSFDLTGLPPSSHDIEAFMADTSPVAYERMVERYLASPHYGERWGKYWLDAAGYSDSNGYFNADSDRPLAYHYRDYVIAALNADKPYNRFVAEQIAGDELAGYSPSVDLVGPSVNLVTATHFLRNAPDGTGESDGNPDEVRIDQYTVLEGNLHNLMSCLLGITIQCARCHDHKFEPVSQRDYYSLQAILFPAYCPPRWRKPSERVAVVGARAEREAHERQNRQIQKQIDALKASRQSIEQPFREQFLEERLARLAIMERDLVLRAFRTPADKRSPDQVKLLQEYRKETTIDNAALAKRFPELAALGREIDKALAARERERPQALPARAILVDIDPKPPAHHVLVRGQHHVSGSEVQPGVPAALAPTAPGYRVRKLPDAAAGTGRRLALADWLTARENALFVRVIVNRIWQHHFGVGLSATSNNLGQSGARPSHPELLEFLAGEFVRSGYSIKYLHRLISRSAVYRQSSRPSAAGEHEDPENRLLWRFPIRRLDAEAIRDGMLAVSGRLNRHMGGPYVPTKRLPEGSVEVDEVQVDSSRRSVYLQQRRTQVTTFLEVFDAPGIVANCTARNTSTVPLQSLALFNSAFASACADAFARKVLHESPAVVEARLHIACLAAWGRPPSSAETAAALRFLAAQQRLYQSEKKDPALAWKDLCQVVMAGNAFLYIE